MSWQDNRQTGPYFYTGYTDLQGVKRSHDGQNVFRGDHDQMDINDNNRYGSDGRGPEGNHFTSGNQEGNRSNQHAMEYSNPSSEMNANDFRGRRPEEYAMRGKYGTTGKLLEQRFTPNSMEMSDYIPRRGLQPTAGHFNDDRFRTRQEQNDTGQSGARDINQGVHKKYTPTNENSGYIVGRQLHHGRYRDPSEDIPRDHVTWQQDEYVKPKGYVHTSQVSDYSVILPKPDNCIRLRSYEFGDGDYLHSYNENISQYDGNLYEDGKRQDDRPEVDYFEIDPDYPGCEVDINVNSTDEIKLGGATIDCTTDKDTGEYFTLPESEVRPPPPPWRPGPVSKTRAMWFVLCAAIIVVLGAITGGVLYAFLSTEPINNPPDETPAGWTEWTMWSACDKSCDQGKHFRKRDCQSMEGDEETCLGPDKQTQYCTEQLCPEPPRGVWSSWSQWSFCTVTCDPGTQSRDRQCDQGSDNVACEGVPAQTRDCNHGNCPDTDASCPGGGVVNSEGNQCICNRSSPLQLTVTDNNNIPLHLVTVSDWKWSGIQLDISNPDGWIELAYVCEDTELIFNKAGFVTQNVTVTDVMDTTIKMSKIAPLYVVAHPQNKLRLECESVRFCCSVKGNPPAEYFEWLHDGVFVYEDRTGGCSSEHSVTMISEDKHTGGYTCKAHNRYSAVTSYAGSLTVKDQVAAFCSTSLQSKTISIPNCIGNKAVEVDVGMCEPLPCRDEDTDNDNLFCGDQGGLCCGPKSTATTTVECGSTHVLVPIIIECGCLSCPEEGIHIRGKVLDYDTGLPIVSAVVTAVDFESGETSSDQTGSFFLVLSDVHNERQIVLTTSHAHYAELPRYVDVTNPGQTHVEIFQMIKKDDPIQIESSEDSILPLYKSSPSIRMKRSLFNENSFKIEHSLNASIFIEGDSFLQLNGSQYIGNVNASITSIDTSDFNAMMNAPAKMNYINSNGEYQPLRAYSLFTLNFVDAIHGNMLQLRKNVSIVIELPYTTEDVALFLYNDQSATWDKDIQFNMSDKAKISGSFFVPQEISWLMVASEVQSNDICFSKVMTFETNNYENLLANEPTVTIIVNNQPSGHVPNYGEISRFRAISDEGNVNGYCIAHSCQRTSSAEQYTGLFTVKSGTTSGISYLTPALQHEGITKETAELIDYGTSQISGIPLSKAILNYNIIPEGSSGPYYDQNKYNWQRSDTCSKLPSDHFRFYQENSTSEEETCINESGFTVLEEAIFPAPGPDQINNLAWFGRSKRSLYDTCYFKVWIETSKPVSMRVLSKVGNISYGNDIVAGESLFGFRDKCQVGAMCLEVKHPGKVADDQIDNTLIEISHLEDDISCSVQDVKRELHVAYGDYISTRIGHPQFHMRLKDTPFGPTFGIYCVKSEQNKQTARDKAKAMCYRGDYDDSLILPATETEENWAVHFRCD